MLPVDHMGTSASIAEKKNNFARECPVKSINHSALIHPVVADGTPEEAERRWRRWQQCFWYSCVAQNWLNDVRCFSNFRFKP